MSFKRVIGILLCLCLTASLLSGGAVALINEGVSVGGVGIGKGKTISCGGGTAALSADGTVLTLNNAVITPTSAAAPPAAIFSDTDLKIELIGDNVLYGPDSPSGGDSYGIWTPPGISLTISGSGSLIITGGAADVNSYGIYSDTITLQLTGSGFLIARGGTVKSGISQAIYETNSNLTSNKTKAGSPTSDFAVYSAIEIFESIEKTTVDDIATGLDFSLYQVIPTGRENHISWADNTLTLKDIVINASSTNTASSTNADSYGLWLPKNAKLVIEGVVIIRGDSPSKWKGYGIYGDTFSIGGSGKLVAIGSTAGICSEGSNPTEITLKLEGKTSIIEPANAVTYCSNFLSSIGIDSTPATLVILKTAPAPTPPPTPDAPKIQISFDLPLTSTVSINVGNGSEIPPISLGEGERLDVSRLEITRPGYELVGWYADEELTTPVYFVEPGQNVSIYASWKSLASLDNFKPVKSYTGYEDVDESQWYGLENTGAVSEATILGLMEGTGAERFDPNGEMKISEAIKIACILHSIYYNNGYVFEKTNPWYVSYLAYALENGIIKSTDFSSYDTAATRAQAAYIFANALPKELYEKISNLTPSDLNEDDPYYEMILLLYKSGILMGNDEAGTFGGDGSFTRAQAAAIAVRLCKLDSRIAVAEE